MSHFKFNLVQVGVVVKCTRDSGGKKKCYSVISASISSHNSVMEVCESQTKVRRKASQNNWPVFSEEEWPI